MKITIYRNGNDGGLSIEDGESAADVTRVIMQSAVSFVVSSVPSDLNNTQKEEIVRNFAKAAELEMRLALSRNPVTGRFEDKEAAFMEELIKTGDGGQAEMTLEEYKNILITGTPSDRARAIAEAGNDRSLTDEEFHELTAMIKGVVRPGRRKMTPDEAKLWAEVSRINTRLKDEMVNAGFAVRALPGDLQEDAINVLSHTVSGMMSSLAALMAETGEP